VVISIGDQNREHAYIAYFIVIAITGKVAVINPDLARRLDTDSITCRGEDFCDFDVANDDVGYVQNT
jgi:hypothetical protein